MINYSFWLMLITVFGITACANDRAVSSHVTPPQPQRYYQPVDVALLSDNRGELPEFPVSGNPGTYRAYVEAAPNERYRVRVVNNSGQRVGIVIAVDGRNIITGNPSWLQGNERMYILEPYGRGEYEGWRTGANRVNRFFFTDAGNSYAAAFGDNSAMGVIAVAVFAERPPVEVMDTLSGGGRFPQAAAKAETKAQAAPGTGYGETRYSPSQIVNFDPMPEPVQKVFLKYEWRSTLCAKHILPDCQIPDSPGNNRFWPDDTHYAPPPPRR